MAVIVWKYISFSHATLVYLSNQKSFEQNYQSILIFISHVIPSCLIFKRFQLISRFFIININELYKNIKGKVLPALIVHTLISEIPPNPVKINSCISITNYIGIISFNNLVE